jgi:hypothetical protein
MDQTDRQTDRLLSYLHACLGVAVVDSVKGKVVEASEESSATAKDAPPTT